MTQTSEKESLSLARQDFFNMLTELKNPSLNRTGYGYKYSDLAGILHVVKPTLAQYNFAMSQESMEANEYEVKIKTVLHHRIHGPYVSSIKSMPVKTGTQDAGKYAQAFGIVSTYCRRYAICEILGIVGEDDTDGNFKQAQQSTVIDAKNLEHKKKVEEYTIKTETLEHLPEILEMINGKSPQELPGVIKKIRTKYGIK